LLLHALCPTHSDRETNSANHSSSPCKSKATSG
jgi:hypothetical protein